MTAVSLISVAMTWHSRIPEHVFHIDTCECGLSSLSLTWLDRPGAWKTGITAKYRYGNITALGRQWLCKVVERPLTDLAKPLHLLSKSPKYTIHGAVTTSGWSGSGMGRDGGIDARGVIAHTFQRSITWSPW